MAAAGTFGMIGVDGAALEGGEGAFHEPGLVERIRVDCDLDIEFIRNGEAGVDGGRRGAPILVKLETDGSGEDLLAQRFRRRAVAFAEETEIDWECFRGLEHAPDVPLSRGAGGGVGPMGWPG